MNKAKILVVDDENMIRINLEAFLEDEGFEVVSVSSGEQAIEAFQKHNDFDAAIVDIRLPGIDGNAVIAAGHKLSPKTKYILHTGSSEYVLNAELVGIGITEEQILFKPLIEMQSLLDVLQKILTR